MNINLNIPINDTGYGVVSKNIARELNQDNSISLFPIGQPSAKSQKEYDMYMQMLNNAITFDSSAPTLKIWHQFDLAQRTGNGIYTAFPFFELDTFDDREKYQMKVPDQFVVASTWAKEVMEKNGITQSIKVVPMGVDRSIFDSALYANEIANKDKYIFLTIGKWEVRKGHDILDDIFSKAFPNQKDVELWILAAEHTSSYCTKQEIEEWKNKYAKDSRIRIIGGVETQQEIAKIIQYTDCGLYISRAEGWNLELLETMSMNKPCIATDYSGHKEFCNKDNCFLVNITDLEPAFDGKAFKKQGNWAKIDNNSIEQTIEHMRYVYNNNIKTNEYGLETAKKLSWENTAKQISEFL
jgi:glycosyltransferase involved in cell wall biosynthesis